MNESGELQDLLTKIEVSFFTEKSFSSKELQPHLEVIFGNRLVAFPGRGVNCTTVHFLEGPASPDVPDLWGLCLHSVSDVPWQQDVCVPQLLHGFLQSPQVHFLQRERPAAMRELQ